MGRTTTTLPAASAGGQLPYFSITAAGWEQIEGAYGRSLSEGVRQAINESTDDYIRSGAFERDVERLLEELS